MGLRVGPAQPVGQPEAGQQEADTADDRRRVELLQKDDLARVLPGARVAKDALATVIHGLAAAKAERPGLVLIVLVVRGLRVVLGIVMGVRVWVVRGVRGVRGLRVDLRIAHALKVGRRRVL